MRQNFLSRSAAAASAASDESRKLANDAAAPAAPPTRDTGALSATSVEGLLLEQEAKRLDAALGESVPPPRLSPRRHHSPTRSLSPVRLVASGRPLAGFGSRRQ